ncbi:alpha/beta fold hydrolase [Nocardioides lijunqiniae]|uniref:alpha/beta fold hydrolase n=1 Tax=Nocardioides lijunqiniae TaxID=2760832 RepID=UPI001878CF52|nr:alpha/beta hydrolase [Nocardioides lijunqiniae]
MSAIARHGVSLSGPEDGQPMLFAHGFGCDQSMWRYVAPAFADRYRVITFDHVGSGGSDVSAYDPDKYSTNAGYAADVVEIVRELDLHDVVFVGHSVSSMIGALAVIEAPERFDRLVMVSPSPRYIDDGDYTGGFSHEDIDELLESLSSNFLGWSAAMAPVIVGNPDRPALGEELTASFCRMDPDIARRFATTTFLSDNRADLPKVDVPTLVLQCIRDAIAPAAVGRYVADTIPDATLVQLDATGHCPNLSAPEETIAAIEGFLRQRVAP